MKNTNTNTNAVITLTKNEAEVLQVLLAGMDDEGTGWLPELQARSNKGVRSFAGTVTSLEKKGLCTVTLIPMDFDIPACNWVELTEAGFAVARTDLAKAEGKADKVSKQPKAKAKAKTKAKAKAKKAEQPSDDKLAEIGEAIIEQASAKAAAPKRSKVDVGDGVQRSKCSLIDFVILSAKQPLLKEEILEAVLGFFPDACPIKTLATINCRPTHIRARGETIPFPFARPAKPAVAEAAKPAKKVNAKLVNKATKTKAEKKASKPRKAVKRTVRKATSRKARKAA